MTSDDVEKRWYDPTALRAAVKYVISVVILAGFALFTAIRWDSLVAAVLVPTIVFIGGVGAFVKTYQVWRAAGVWVIWQGAGWFLLALMLIFLGVPVAVWKA